MATKEMTWTLMEAIRLAAALAREVEFAEAEAMARHESAAVARAAKALSPRPAPELRVGDKVRVRLVSGAAGERKAHNFVGRVKALTIGERGGMALVTSEGNTAGEWFGISARLCQVEKFYQ